MIKISKRLLKISELVKGNIVADVGCDHGKLSEYLLKQKLCEKVIVSDISKSSLQKAINLLSKEKLNFESIHCNGLVGYKDKVIDECIISGMGGDEIIKIISSSPIEIKSYILSPQHNIIDVKKFMLDNGFTITFDKIIKDKNKFYTILKCVKNGEFVPITIFDLYFGQDNFNKNCDDFKDFLECELKKNILLMDKVDDKKKSEILEYINLIEIAKKRLVKYE